MLDSAPNSNINWAFYVWHLWMRWGHRASPLLLEGLKRLEYRGYDSADLALREADGLRVVKAAGRVQMLSDLVTRADLQRNTGISHTRGATHGAVTDENAHPHISYGGKIALVHNGVIENFSSITRFLEGLGYQFQSDESVEPVIDQVDWEFEESHLGSFCHYMEKEVFEQPEALENAVRGRFSDDLSTAKFRFNVEPRELRQIDRILFCACGTAWHACLVAEYLIERYTRIPVEVEYASEFRYRNAPLEKNTLVFVISQSGETIDTLEALRESKRKGYRTLAITNVVGSTIAREADGGIYPHAGPEIGVASTKAFTSQILLSAMMALYLGRLRDLSYSDGTYMVRALKQVPSLVKEILDQREQIREIADRYAHCHDFLFLGRQAMFPIALEGALKLRELSYIHIEGYPAAEMKHGPIALICPDCPTVFLASPRPILQKSLANIQEIKARGGPIIVITSAGHDFPRNLADQVIQFPECRECIHPILASIPVQLLAYDIAVNRACDVDKPRNLAKSVTVE